MHFAKHAAASALLNGWKSVELSQAYILMSLYGVPARRWEEDRPGGGSIEEEGSLDLSSIIDFPYMTDAWTRSCPPFPLSPNLDL